MRNLPLTRREFCGLITSIAISTISGCRLTGATSSNSGRLSARPHLGVKPSANGRIALGIEPGDRDAILQLPKSEGPVPLLLMLHGATQNAEDMFWYLGSKPEEAGVAVLAPNSRDTTWDAIGGSFGPDVEYLNRALERVFQTAAIDPARVCAGGFSDGASYALALGLINSDLFSGIAAFSPGFVPLDDATQIEILSNKKPRVFISHGTHDHILPIDSGGRRISAGLKSRDFDVTYREFDGDHEIPADVAREGMKWVTALGK
jgi:predicted esterase